VPQAFPTRGRGEPGAEALGVLDPIEVLNQPKPGGLSDVGGFRRRQSMGARNRPDETGKTVNDD
jgi:hypothetical protein